MLPALIGIGAGVSALSGLVGFLQENGREEEAQRILAEAGRDYDNMSLPRLQEISARVLGPTAFEQIRQTPEFRSAQINALDKLGEMEQGGGFNLEDKANLNRVRNGVAQADSSRQAAIEENMQARGIAGGGSELAMRLASSQNASNQENQAGLDIAASARNRYFQAVRERAGLAGQMRGQEFDEQSQIAQAKDARDVFNYGAQRQNEQYNNSLRQQQFGNNMQLTDRRYGVAQDRAGAIRNQGQRQGQVIAGVGNAVGGGLSNFGAQMGGTQYGSGQQGLDPNTNVRPPVRMNSQQEDEEELYGK